MADPKNILVIRFSSLGDLVLTTPLYRELKRAFPLARLTLLTSSVQGRVLDNNPHLDRVIHHRRGESWSELQELAAALQRENYDLVYDAHRSLRSRWIVWRLTAFGLRRIPEVWGIDKRTLRRQLRVFRKMFRSREEISQRSQWLLPLKHHTHLRLEEHTELFPGKDEVEKVREVMLSHGLKHGSFIGVGPSAYHPLKCWPLDHYSALISELLEWGWKVALVGGKEEPEPELLENEFSGSIVNLAGALTPLESAELLRHAKRVVTNDSSVVHLAEAVGTAVLALFGPTVGAFGYGPFLPQSVLVETEHELRCRPCSTDGRGLCSNPHTLECLKSISPRQVLNLLNPPVSN